MPALGGSEREYRLRADKVGKTGKVTLRWHGDLKRLYVGRRWAREPIPPPGGSPACPPAHSTGGLNALLTKLSRYHLLIVDEVGDVRA